jgi:dienelactone hydrolase
MRKFAAGWAAALVLVLAVTPGSPSADDKKFRILRTPDGVRFGLLGDKGAAPAPTLFVVASSIEDTLGPHADDYNRVGRILARHGYLCVALDVPCHGADIRNKEPAGLDGWRARLEKGEDFVPGFVAKCSGVLDYLVKEGYTDPRRVAVAGTSRGGFIGLHFAAAEPRVRAVAAFAPVTNLLALREFAGMDRHPATRSLALANRAGKLAGRNIWVCIGNRDDRVNTDDVIAFTRRVVAASDARDKAVPIELHVMPTVGHRIHDTAHEEVAAWVLKCMKEAR